MKDNSDIPFGKETVSLLSQILVQQYLDRKRYNSKENEIRKDENKSTSHDDKIHHFLQECSIGTYHTFTYLLYYLSKAVTFFHNIM